MKNNPGKKLYSILEFYKISYLAFYSIPEVIHIKKKEVLSDSFMERIMLAVTEVNGCEICSFAHTKMALEAGMTNEEIKKMLAGENNDVPKKELPAVMFAQHYADTRGKPSKKSWERVIEIYGLKEATDILASIRIMMLGNVVGIAWSSFVNRFKRKPDSRSSLLYEIGMILATFIFIPISLIHGLSAKLFKIPTTKFKN